jgi:hypothetical protein
LAEWPVAVMVFLLFFIFPLIDLVAIGSAFAVISLIDYQSVVRASSQQTFNTALSSSVQEIQALNTSAFARFAHLKPVGGYQNSGMDLYIDATNYWNNQSQIYGPNQPLAASVDRTNEIFEYRGRVIYDVTPFINLSSAPFIQNVPGLGKPFRLEFQTRRAVEHPEGMGASIAGGTYSGGGTSLDLGSLSGVNTPGTLDDGSGSGWNYPNIYQMIAAAGETVIEQDVVKVYANDPNWTTTGLTVPPGAKVWIDSRADGSWTYLTTANTFFDANGNPQLTNATGFPTGALLGQIGGSMFMMGKDKWNYPPPSTGTLYLAMNDDAGPGFNRPGYLGNRGVQDVRVIIAR